MSCEEIQKSTYGYLLLPRGIYAYEDPSGITFCFDKKQKNTALKTGINPFTNLSLEEGRWISPIWDEWTECKNMKIDNITIKLFIDKLSHDFTLRFNDPRNIIFILQQADPSGSCKFVRWIILSYINDGIKKFEDILSRTRPALEDFIILGNNNILEIGDSDKPWENETDINNFCGIVGCEMKRRKRLFSQPGLEDLIDKYEKQLKNIKREKEEEEKGASEAELVYEDEYVRIYHLLTEAAAIYYGRGTRWCTAAKKNNMFDDYNKDGPLYVLIPKNPKHDGEKYQLFFDFHHEESDCSEDSPQQFMDEKDEEVLMDDLRKVFPKFPDWVLQDPRKRDEMIISIIMNGDVSLLKELIPSIEESDMAKILNKLIGCRDTPYNIPNVSRVVQILVKNYDISVIFQKIVEDYDISETESNFLLFLIRDAIYYEDIDLLKELTPLIEKPVMLEILKVIREYLKEDVYQKILSNSEIKQTLIENYGVEREFFEN